MATLQRSLTVVTASGRPVLRDITCRCEVEGGVEEKGKGRRHKTRTPSEGGSKGTRETHGQKPDNNNMRHILVQTMADSTLSSGVGCGLVKKRGAGVSPIDPYITPGRSAGHRRKEVVIYGCLEGWGEGYRV